MSVFIIFLLFTCNLCAKYDLNPQTKHQVVTLQIGQVVDMNYPTSYKSDIYSRWVVDANNNTESLSKFCWQNGPTIDFQEESSYVIDAERKHPSIATDFADLQYRRSIIDSKMVNGSVYTLFKNGSLLILNFNKDNQLWFNKMLTIRNGTMISEGEIVVANNRVVLFADNYVYIVEQKSINELEGYKQTTKFSTAIALDKGFIAVAQRQQGVAIYQLADSKLNFKGIYQKQFFTHNQTMYIVDLTTNDKEVLYVLDQKSGMHMMNLTLLYNGQHQPELIPNGVLKTNCDNILYYRGQILMVCGDVFKYRIQSNQSLQQLPKPLFKVKQMVAYDDLVVMMGDNLFKIYWHDRYLELVEFIGSNNIILTRNKYVAVQDSSIYSGRYIINFPTLKCQASTSMQERATEVLFKTAGRCFQSYMKNVSTDTPIYSANDTCIYTTLVTVNPWKEDDVDYRPVIIGGIILGVIVMILIIWMCLIALKQQSLTQILQRYKGRNRANKQYNVMDDEKESNLGSSEINRNTLESNVQDLMTVHSSIQHSKRDENSRDINPSYQKESITDQVHDIGN